MRVLRLALCVLMAAMPAAADQRGQLVDARTGRPVAGAEVTLTGMRGTARSDASGQFVWPPGVQAPVTLIVVLADGRVAPPVHLQVIDAAATTRIEIDAAYGATVTVQGAAPDIDASPGASTSRTVEADLSMRRPATVSQALELFAGVSAISEGQNATPAIRGLARGRTLILLDGARVTSERGAGPNAAFVDPDTLWSASVARGPGSVAYGSDALGGVIALTTRRPDPRAPLAVRAAATAGHGIPDRRAHLEVSTGYGSGAVLAGLRWREAASYSAPDLEIPHSGWRDRGARVAWSHAFGDTRVNAGWQTDLGRDIGRPRSDAATIVASSPFEDSHRLTVAVERAQLGAIRDLRVDALLGSSTQRAEQDRLPAPGRPRRVDRSDTAARDLQLRVTAGRLLRDVRVTFGGEVHGRVGVTSSETAVLFNAAGLQTSATTSTAIERAHRTTAGAFAQADAALTDWLRLTIGLRGDRIRSVNRGGFFGDRTITHHAGAGAVAATLRHASRWSTTVQLARGFRDPTLTDRFSRGVVGRGFLEGNPDLRPETSLQLDVRTAYVGEALQVSGAVYDYRLRDLVERYSPAADLFTLRNRGRARLSGAEVEARVNLGAGAALDVTAATSYGRGADDVPLDDVAPRAVAVTVRHAWAGRLRSYVRVAGVARRDDPGPGEVATPGYTVIDAAASWQVSRLVELQALIRNGLNAAYYASAGPRWVWAPGRSVTATLVVRR